MKSENLGVTTPVVGENAATKKKVRVVKKIVKKKIVKKVPKRVLVASGCNDLEKVSSPNPNENALMEIEKPNPAADVLEEVENVKEFDVSGMEKGVLLVESKSSCRNESQRSVLVNSSLLVDQNQIESQDGDRNPIELQDSDQNRNGLQDDDQNQIELQDNDQNQIELQDNDQNQIELQESDQNPIELQESDQNRIELQDSDLKLIELQEGDQKPIELQDKECDINSMNVEDLEGEEGVKELAVNSETDGLKSKEILIEKKAPSEEMIACGLHMKQRTKIFIRGLVEGTKEEDIRKVFEEIGEVVEVKIITNFRSGKSRGFGFIRYASADLANLALIKYQNVEICGRLCHTAAIEGNDTILLSNIDRKWKNDDVAELLRKTDIKEVNKVLVVPDPDNSELNRGFVFLEFETKRDAQMAYNKLQNKNVFGKHPNINVSWAEPFVDPVEENMHKGQLKVSLAKSPPKVKPMKTFLDSGVNEVSKLNQKSNQSRPYESRYPKASQSRQSQQHLPYLGVYKPPQMPKNMTGRHEDSRKDLGSSTTAELVQLLREQASWKHGGPSSSAVRPIFDLLAYSSFISAGMSIGHHQSRSGGKQPFIELGSKSLYHHDHRAYHQTHLQIPNAAHPRPMANMTSFPHDQQHALYKSGSFNVSEPDPRYFQTRDQTAYPGSSSIYRLMR